MKYSAFNLEDVFFYSICLPIGTQDEMTKPPIKPVTATIISVCSELLFSNLALLKIAIQIF